MAAMPQGGGLGGLGGPPNPDELLAQIRALLDQYLALGDSTPVAAQAQQLAQAIDSTGGGAAPADPMADPSTAPPDPGMGGGLDSMTSGPEPPPNTDAKTYDQANVSALDRLKKRNKNQGQ